MKSDHINVFISPRDGEVYREKIPMFLQVTIVEDDCGGYDLFQIDLFDRRDFVIPVIPECGFEVEESL